MAYQSVMVIIFFLGTALSQDIGPVGPVEIAFSFDTTGSMYPVLDQVRNVLTDMLTRLQSDIPGIRMAVFAHGDYHDTYISKFVDLTTDADLLRDFVKHVGPTGGGDSPEAYEVVLDEAGRKLSWTPGSQRSLVLIGDENPHEPGYRKNMVDWRNATNRLGQLGVRIYSIKAQNADSGYFYKSIANMTGGYFLQLNNFNSIFDFIMAISYREYGLEYLEAYESEVRSRPGGITPELARLFHILKTTPHVRRPQIDPPTQAPVSTTVPPPTTRAPPTKNTEMDIYSLHIQSNISYRFAHTTVTSRLANIAANASEASFFIRLPKAAFISNFSMVIDGETYAGKVKEKEAAKRTYQRAKARGESAGHVQAVPRDTNSVKVSVNIAARSKVTFTLTYEELLERRLGVYEHVIHIDPGQMVDDLQVKVNIDESRDLTFVRVPPLRNDLMNTFEEEVEIASVSRPTSKSAQILYTPDEFDQKEQSEYGLRGQFVVQYDVARTKDAGEIHVVDGYFVHFFAPEGLPPVNKNVMFVLDTSGSMYDTKLAQLKDAMSTILAQLRPGDNFNILSFSSFFRQWKEEDLVPASEENIEEAKEWVNKMFAAGGTNINSALDKGLEFLQAHINKTLEDEDPSTTSLMVFLTDGQPTDGVTDKKIIMANTKGKNLDRFTIFSLGFGTGVDFNFLQAVSLQNSGFARKIYADSDAALQLQGFFSEIASPIMSDVELSYLDSSVNDTTLTPTSYRTLYNGSEIIVAGALNDLDTNNLVSQISGYTQYGDEVYSMVVEPGQKNDDLPSASNLPKILERLWAYRTIKELFKKALETTDKDEKAALKEEALELSLKYHFVTPVTSMVVTKPEEEEKVDEGEEEKEEEKETETPEAGLKGSPGHDLTDADALPAPRRGSSAPRYESAPAGRGGYADNDPHFIMHMSGSVHPVCFDVSGSPGEIYQLLHDPKTDVTVNALIIGKINPALPAHKQKTYFGKIAVMHHGVSVITATNGIKCDKTKVRWKTGEMYECGDMIINIIKKRHLVVTVGTTRFMIIRHKVERINPYKVDFLGFYIEHDEGLSEEVHGLLGQFQHLEVSVPYDIDSHYLFHDEAKLSFPHHKHRNKVTVYAGQRRNMATKKHEKCWHIRDNGHGLIEGHYTLYQVPRLQFSKRPAALKKFLSQER